MPLGSPDGRSIESMFFSCGVCNASTKRLQLAPIPRSPPRNLKLNQVMSTAPNSSTTVSTVSVKTTAIRPPTTT